MFRMLMAPVMIATANVPAAAQIAQPGQQAPRTPLSKATVTALVQEANRLLKQYYLFPDKVGAITARLSAGLASGRYNVTDPATLGQLMTADMQAVTSDKHMSVNYNPDQAKADLAARNNPAPGNGPANAYFAQMMANSNYGIPELKVLPGNVRYMNISPVFLWDPANSPRAIDNAMWFLKGGDAYIIDIRGALGGSPATVRYIVSHFMEPDQKLMTYVLGGQPPSESRTQQVPTGKLTAPLFVLTGPDSASASEEFASHIKHFKLGTLVGTQTPGAGNRNNIFGTPQGFTVSISVGTAFHPVTNKSWEGNGIIPDIATPAPAALNAAHLEALKRVKQTATGSKLAQIEWTMTELVARANPPRVSAQELAAYAGSYASGRKVSEQNGKLYWHYGPQQWEMAPYGQDVFGLRDGPNIRLRFPREGGRITGVQEVHQNGSQADFARTGS